MSTDVLGPGALVRTAYGMTRYGRILQIDPRPASSDARWEAVVFWRDAKDPQSVSAYVLSADVPIIERLALMGWLSELDAA